MPIVRIILPTFNRSKIISQSIQSALDQTFQDFDLLIADDGSTDNTEAIIRHFSNTDSRILYCKYSHSGVAATRNKAIHEPGQFKYIAFLDSDDIWLPQHLESSVKILEQEDDIDVIFSRVTTETAGNINQNQNWYVERDERLRWPVKNAQRVTRDGAYVTNPNSFLKAMLRSLFSPQVPTVMIRYGAISDRTWFDEKLKVLSDVDFFLRISSQRHVFAFLDSIHCSVRHFGDNLTGLKDLASPTFLERQLSVLSFCKRKASLCRDLEEIKFVNQQISSQSYLLAQSFSAQENLQKARSFYIESLRHHFNYPASKGLLSTFIPIKIFLLLKKYKNRLVMDSRAVNKSSG